MGSQDVTGWLLVASGAVNVGGALPALVRARRSEARSVAIPARAWSGLLAGLGVLAGGFLYLRYPEYPHGIWLNWIPRILAGGALILLIVPGIVSRGRARRLGVSSADTPGLSSGHMPSP